MKGADSGLHSPPEVGRRKRNIVKKLILISVVLISLLAACGAPEFRPLATSEASASYTLLEPGQPEFDENCSGGYKRCWGVTLTGDIRAYNINDDRYVVQNGTIPKGTRVYVTGYVCTAYWTLAEVNIVYNLYEGTWSIPIVKTADLPQPLPDFGFYHPSECVRFYADDETIPPTIVPPQLERPGVDQLVELPLGGEPIDPEQIKGWVSSEGDNSYLSEVFDCAAAFAGPRSYYAAFRTIPLNEAIPAYDLYDDWFFQIGWEGENLFLTSDMVRQGEPCQAITYVVDMGTYSELEMRIYHGWNWDTVSMRLGYILK